MKHKVELPGEEHRRDVLKIIRVTLNKCDVVVSRNRNLFQFTRFKIIYNDNMIFGFLSKFGGKRAGYKAGTTGDENF